MDTADFPDEYEARLREPAIGLKKIELLILDPYDLAARLPARFARMLDESVSDAEPLGLSPISLWEIAMLTIKKQVQLLGSLDTFLREVESHALIRMLPMTACVAESTRLGPAYPRDPVDRIIGATARCYGLRLMTADEDIRNSGVVALA